MYIYIYKYKYIYNVLTGKFSVKYDVSFWRLIVNEDCMRNTSYQCHYRLISVNSRLDGGAKQAQVSSFEGRQQQSTI